MSCFFLRFDFNKEPLPDVLGPKGGWYQSPMLKGNKDKNRLLYEEQRKAHRDAFDRADIFCSKATHACRVMGANRMHDLGVDLDQISQLGGWSAIGALLKYGSAYYDQTFVSMNPIDDSLWFVIVGSYICIDILMDTYIAPSCVFQ